MDFRNFCQKLDVDTIRAKIPQLPQMPQLPQLKLPKSLPKLKSRKIFRSSREDVNKTTTKQQQQQHQRRQIQPHADFINHTPVRISTISSLMYEQCDDDDVGAVDSAGVSSAERYTTYRRAGSVDDDYPSPKQYTVHDRERVSRPISPIRMPISESSMASSAMPPNTSTSSSSVRMSLTDKIQKGYKDISEFKLKHLFAKKTVIRKDNIEVDRYVERYDEERLNEQLEQEKRDREIADNYHINFTLSRQNTVESEEDSTPRMRSKNNKSVGEHSGDESGMEATPPTRKPGIAATRFAKVRKPPLRMTSEELADEEIQALSCDEVKESTESIEATTATKPKGYRQHIRRLKGYMSSHEETDTETVVSASTGATGEQESRGVKFLTKLSSLGNKSRSEPVKTTPAAAPIKRKAPLSPQQSAERVEPPETAATVTTAIKADTPLNAMKQNFKRFQKSMKRTQTTTTTTTTITTTTDDSEDDENVTKVTQARPPSKTEKFAARLRRFKSTEEVQTSPKNDADLADSKTTSAAYVNNKLQTWKKSFKKRTTETEASAAAGNTTGDETSPEKQKRSGTLMKKLKYIRARKTANNSNEELDIEDNEEPTTSHKSKDGTSSRRVTTNFEDKFEQVREKTMKKVNEKMQQMKFFHRSQETVDNNTNGNTEQQTKTTATTAEQKKKSTKHPNNNNSSSSSDEDENIASLVAEASNLPPTISRRYIPDDYEHSSDQDEIEEIDTVQAEHAARSSISSIGSGGGTLTAWTTKPILCDSMESDTETEYPRVLIHQDNSDVFESTLIIAVTRPSSTTPSMAPKISEILQEKRALTPPPTRPIEWISNKQIITDFLETTTSPPPRRKQRRLSTDSNTDSEIWLPVTARNNNQNIVIGAAVSVEEEPWKVHSMYKDEKLYKTKSIDIFETKANQNGANAVFADFDDELKNEPILKIATASNIDSFERESSEDPEAADDDNSSRVTKIQVRAVSEELNSNTASMEVKRMQRQIGNSRESLIAHIGESEEMDSDENEDDDEDDDDDDDDQDDDRPPSAAPSPPPAMSPPPPPLPERRPLHDRAAAQQPQLFDEIIIKPSLPLAKPPLPATTHRQPLPKIPERAASMTRIAKPLVKTSSLRLAYNEQVKPSDVGKVNKLISRFEPTGTKMRERPRIISRRLQSQESEDYSDEEQYLEENDDELNANARTTSVIPQILRDTTPTPTNATTEMRPIDQQLKVTKTITSTMIATTTTTTTIPEIITTRDMDNNRNYTRSVERAFSDVSKKSTLSLNRNNSNCSHPNSEYGSPLAYPSSLRGSNETTPIPERKQQQQSLHQQPQRRRRRSMTREDDNFYSFDSDEENSYYSISPSGSSRYIVEI